MRWIAPTEKDDANHLLEKRLWDAADQFRANSGLKAAQYSAPVLGLIFLRFAEARFAQRRAQLEKVGASPRRVASRIDDPKAYQVEGVLFLTPNARFDFLLQRPEGSNVGKAVNEAMADAHVADVAHILELDPLRASQQLNRRPTRALGKWLQPARAMRELVARLAPA